AVQAGRNAAGFLWEVLGILPAVMVIVGLIDVWLPRRAVERNIGPGAGLRGSLLALMLGVAAAGPIYAAFPLAVSLQAKGARTAHVVTLLGAWATIKVPMLLMEASFVGLRFALLRLALTLPCVLAMGWIMERALGPGPAAGESHVPARV
ncbi:MAG: permease, partial [Desulfovibrionaceae bacterium]